MNDLLEWKDLPNGGKSCELDAEVYRVSRLTIVPIDQTDLESMKRYHYNRMTDHDTLVFGIYHQHYGHWQPITTAPDYASAEHEAQEWFRRWSSNLSQRD